MASIAADERFDLGRVIGRAAGAIQRNLVLFAILALLLQFLPALLIRAFALMPVTTGVGVLPSFGAGYFIALLATLAFYYVLQAAVTHVTIVDLKNEKPTLGPALTRGFQLILPLVGLAIVAGFGMMIGFLFLIIPGVILAIMWAVAVPVMVEERVGVFASLGRSRALTKGSRWSIFLLALGIFLLAMLMSGVIVLMTTGLDPQTMLATANASSGQVGMKDIVAALLNSILVVGASALIAAVYVELRYIRDGISPENIAAIFD